MVADKIVYSNPSEIPRVLGDGSTTPHSFEGTTQRERLDLGKICKSFQ